MSHHVTSLLPSWVPVYNNWSRKCDTVSWLVDCLIHQTPASSHNNSGTPVSWWLAPRPVTCNICHANTVTMRDRGEEGHGSRILLLEIYFLRDHHSGSGVRFHQHPCIQNIWITAVGHSFIETKKNCFISLNYKSTFILILFVYVCNNLNVW